MTILSGSTLATPCTAIFTHLRSVVNYVSNFGVKRKVYINPLGTFNDEFYRGGLMFQCVIDSQRRAVFAAGGRYDSLIRECKPKLPNQGDTAHAVGFNLAWDSLYKSMVRYQKNFSKALLKKGEDEYTGIWARRRRVCQLVSLKLL